MRMIYHVIDQILAVMPKDARYLQYPEMVNELLNIKEQALYQAPEQMPPFFQRVSDLLNEHLGEPDTEWKKEIVDIFGDKK